MRFQVEIVADFGTEEDARAFIRATEDLAIQHKATYFETQQEED